jgi:hypothetical protein
MGTTNYNLTTVAGTDPVQDGDDAITALANELDSIIATADGGLLSARPTSSGGTPGIRGRLYRASDDGVLYYDRGTGWDAVGGTLPAAGLTLGTDVNLYRSAANVAATDDDLHVRKSQGSEVRIGSTLASLPGLTLGGDTYLYRTGANAAGTAGAFTAAGALQGATVQASTGTTAVALNASGPGSSAEVVWGGDTALYRNAAKQLAMNGDIEFTRPGNTGTHRGPILWSPLGTRYRITVANDGTLGTEAA